MNKSSLLLLLTIVLMLAPAHALVRVQHKPATAHSNILQQRHLSWFQRFTSSLPRPGRHRPNPDDLYLSNAEGLTAFTASVLAFVSLGALALTTSPLFLISAFGFAIVATIFGSIGIHRSQRGFAIVGLALGLLAMVGGFIALALL